MYIIEKIFTLLTSKYIGSDLFGNKYYESKKRTDSFKKKARYVIYKGKVEPSKVPPMWHAWLHHLSNDTPNIMTSRYKWEKNFIPNLTGTDFAYSPTHGKLSNDYTPWTPGGKK
jgi:NADH:ubiquinone oxidoreductase subunit